MAYNQSGLKNIGDIRKNIIKKKAKGKTMSTQEMKDIVSERFRESMKGPQVIRKQDDGMVKRVLITPESPGVGGYKPIEEGRSLRDIEKKADRQKKIREVGKATGKVTKEVGEKALDIVSPLVPGLGKRRTFVRKSDGSQTRMVFGSGAAFNEAVDQPTNPRTGGKRFKFGEWQKYKRDTYSSQQRRYNIAANIRNKGIVGLGAGLIGHGRMMEKHGGPEKVFKLKDYKPFVGKMIKKGIKKFKGLI